MLRHMTERGTRREGGGASWWAGKRRCVHLPAELIDGSGGRVAACCRRCSNGNRKRRNSRDISSNCNISCGRKGNSSSIIVVAVEIVAVEVAVE